MRQHGGTLSHRHSPQATAMETQARSSNHSQREGDVYHCHRTWQGPAGSCTHHGTRPSTRASMWSRTYAARALRLVFFYASRPVTTVVSIYEQTYTSLTSYVHKLTLQLHIDSKIATLRRSPKPSKAPYATGALLSLCSFTRERLHLLNMGKPRWGS